MNIAEYICVYSGLDPSWYVQHVVVWDPQTDHMFFFILEDWLSVENQKNSSVEREVLASCKQIQMKLIHRRFKVIYLILYLAFCTDSFDQSQGNKSKCLPINAMSLWCALPEDAFFFD